MKNIQVQISEEFNDKEKLVKVENIELRQEQDQAKNNYCKATMIATQHKQDEVSLKRPILELCSELLDMKLYPKASILDNL